MKANDIGRRKLARLSLGSLAAAVSLLVALSLAPNAHAATASWSLMPPSYDFGAIQPGTEPSAPAVFTLANTGEVELPAPRVSTTSISHEGSEPEPFGFGFTAGDCENRANLAPAESCTAEVTFNPFYPGPRQGSITFTDPSSQVAPISATYSGLGIGPIVSFSYPQGLTAVVGEGPSLPPSVLTVTNEGDAALSIAGISLVGENASHFAIVGGKCEPGVIVAPGASCGIQLTYSPTTAGFLFGELQLTDNAAHGYQIAGLLGNGFVPSPRRPAPLATFISQRPRKVSTRRFARFRFAVAGGNVQFACRLDQRPFRPCASPTTYRHLAFGHHLFKVKTLSRTPGVSPAPALARFQVIPRRAG